MKKLIIALIAVAGLVLAADYTPASQEKPVGVITTTTYGATVTNGTVLTPATGFHVIAMSGQTNTAVTTLVLAAPAIAGQEVTLYVAGVSNFPGIADSGTASLSAAFVGTLGDTLSLKAINTSTWVETGRSAN